MEIDKSRLEASHTPEAIRHRIGKGKSRSYLRDLVYGAVDGIVTTFAVVAGVSGARLSDGIVVVQNWTEELKRRVPTGN